MSAAVAMNSDFSNMKWGDIEDDDILPPSQTIGPDKDGVKTIIEFFKDNKGELIKKV